MDHSYASSLTKARMIEEEFLDVAHEVRVTAFSNVESLSASSINLCLMPWLG